jgi:hypothetical protein
LLFLVQIHQIPQAIRQTQIVQPKLVEILKLRDRHKQHTIATEAVIKIWMLTMTELHAKIYLKNNPKTMITLELKSHFLRLYQMALSDDQFDVLELQMLYHFADERGIPREELDKLFLNPINTELIVPENLTTKIEYLYDFTRIIWADGKITDDEENMLKKYCRKFNFLDENINDLSSYLIDCVQKNVQKEEIISQLNS